MGSSRFSCHPNSATRRATEISWLVSAALSSPRGSRRTSRQAPPARAASLRLPVAPPQCHPRPPPRPIYTVTRFGARNGDSYPPCHEPLSSRGALRAPASPLPEIPIAVPVAIALRPESGHQRPEPRFPPDRAEQRVDRMPSCVLKSRIARNVRRRARRRPSLRARSARALLKRGRNCLFKALGNRAGDSSPGYFFWVRFILSTPRSLLQTRRPFQHHGTV